MKKILSFISLTIFFSISLFACSTKKNLYRLDHVEITFVTQVARCEIEEFERKYIGYIDDIGKEIFLESDNCFIFCGQVTKNINGLCEITDDIPGHKFIRFKNKEFYEYYENAYIESNQLCIETKMLAIGEPISTFIFVYEKS